MQEIVYICKYLHIRLAIKSESKKCWRLCVVDQDYDPPHKIHGIRQ
jgi:hypothetical protein